MKKIVANTGPQYMTGDFVNNMRSSCDFNVRLKKEEEL